MYEFKFRKNVTSKLKPDRQQPSSLEHAAVIETDKKMFTGVKEHLITGFKLLIN